MKLADWITAEEIAFRADRGELIRIARGELSSATFPVVRVTGDGELRTVWVPDLARAAYALLRHFRCLDRDHE